MMWTPAALLDRGLALPDRLPPQAPLPCPAGTVSALSGIPLTEGHPAASLLTAATIAPLDDFPGGPHGWVAADEARCYRAFQPSLSIPISRACLVTVEDDVVIHRDPVIGRESSVTLGRPLWSTLVRNVWPRLQGAPTLVIVTTDTQRRVWHKARVGALGEATPVYLHDAGCTSSGVRTVSWPRLLAMLDLIEDVLDAGFVKRAIRVGLWSGLPKGAPDLARIALWEQALRDSRSLPEFDIAWVIAQRRN